MKKPAMTRSATAVSLPGPLGVSIQEDGGSLADAVPQSPDSFEKGIAQVLLGIVAEAWCPCLHLESG